MNFYTPFDNILQNSKKCLLSGKPADARMQVFPDWFLQKFDLENKPFKFIDDEWTTYNDLKIPTNTNHFMGHWAINDKIVRKAFGEGYNEVNNLPKNVLFGWLGRIMYGLVYLEMCREANENTAQDINPSLQMRYEALSMLLQTSQNGFEIDFEPASVLVFEINNPDKECTIKDELNTLCISLIFDNVGITACLADNGRVREYLHKTLKPIEDKTLNLLQFEEINAMLYYTAWLYEPEMDYYFGENTVEWMPNNIGTVFKKWDDKVMAQVLENFWKRFGLTKFEILPYGAEKPMSYL